MGVINLAFYQNHRRAWFLVSTISKFEIFVIIAGQKKYVFGVVCSKKLGWVGSIFLTFFINIFFYKYSIWNTEQNLVEFKYTQVIN